MSIRVQRLEPADSETTSIVRDVTATGAPSFSVKVSFATLGPKMFGPCASEAEALAIAEWAGDLLKRVEQETECAILNQDWRVRVDLPEEISDRLYSDGVV